METVSTNRSHGGTQGVYTHASRSTGTAMTFSVFVPDHAPGTRLPVLWYLSGLTCTHANVTEKGEYRAACAEHGIVFVAPDTSPRGPDLEGNAVPDDPDGAYDFGLGAGFYVDAIEPPYDRHYKMRTYIEDELPTLIAAHFPVDMKRQGITGHSMGGHGALTIALRTPGRFRSVSAFAPIASPMRCDWGRNALAGYLGADESTWRQYDACALVEDGGRLPDTLVDQGEADAFLGDQLRPELLEQTCGVFGQTITLRRQRGYDHSYFFISTFMSDHVEWHAQRLRGARSAAN